MGRARKQSRVSQFPPIDIPCRALIGEGCDTSLMLRWLSGVSLRLGWLLTLVILGYSVVFVLSVSLVTPMGVFLISETLLAALPLAVLSSWWIGDLNVAIRRFRPLWIAAGASALISLAVRPDRSPVPVFIAVAVANLLVLVPFYGYLAIHYLKRITTTSVVPRERRAWALTGLGVFAIVLADGYASRDRLLLRAAKNGSVREARFLLHIGANPNGDVNLETAFVLAAEKGDNTMVRLFLGSGAPPNVPDRYGNTPLVEAINNQHAETCRILVAGHVDPSGRPLAAAAYVGSLPIVRLLLSAGAKVDTPDSLKRTPFMIAAYEQHLDVAEELARAGANIEAADANGVTAYRTAFVQSHKNVLALIDRLRAEATRPDAR